MSDLYHTIIFVVVVVYKQKAKSEENEKILEMAAIMQKAASLNEEKENEQIGLIQRLATENSVCSVCLTTWLVN